MTVAFDTVYIHYSVATQNITPSMKLAVWMVFKDYQNCSICVFWVIYRGDSYA